MLGALWAVRRKGKRGEEGRGEKGIDKVYVMIEHTSLRKDR
jgi:hypothetical protein